MHNIPLNIQESRCTGQNRCVRLRREASTNMSHVWFIFNSLSLKEIRLLVKHYYVKSVASCAKRVSVRKKKLTRKKNGKYFELSENARAYGKSLAFILKDFLCRHNSFQRQIIIRLLLKSGELT
ncbi:hypothetical protein HELRODRAFT_171623 [Helobdella robusta]|uniref:Uncharacterized protein n=1 Tax=Helobdella robusta TaxID=6412 RepID=T1F4H0_HELRO|nr:hypothetical protein HELRODRAFT_171623 [Helobdella robusta]ESO05262.1 hypothetical protein HELRODRAFT_171623 [Helobdella robusta]